MFEKIRGRGEESCFEGRSWILVIFLVFFLKWQPMDKGKVAL